MVGVNRAAAAARGAVVLSALVAAGAAPGLAMAPGYVEPAPVAALLAGWSAASVLVTALLKSRLGPVAALASGLPLAFGGVAVLVAAVPGSRGGLWWGTVDAVAHSGARILTTSLPTPVAADTLALPALGVWLAGAASVLAVRAGSPLTALLCPLAALAGAAVLNGPDISPAYYPAALFALAAVALLAAAADSRPAPGGGSAEGAGAAVAPIAARTRSGRIAGVLPRVLSISAVLALVAGLTAYAGPLALYGTPIRPADPRAAVVPPEEDTAAVSPLSYLAGWSAEPGQRLLRVTSEQPTELRWVTLSDFDGVTWLPAGRYRASSQVLPEPEHEVPPGRPRRVTVDVEELPGHWLPAAGLPRRVEGTPVSFEPASATVRTRSGAAAGLHYRVVGSAPEYREPELKQAGEPDREEFAEYLELPEGTPPEIERIAEAYGDGTPYERANWLAGHLRGNYGFAPEAPGGHGYANLAELLVPPHEQGGGGTSGQFASAFALLARASGLPSRVVVGFGKGTAIDGGEGRLIRSGDAVAWGEVYLRGVGWAPFDVTPGEPKRNGADTGSEADAGGGSGGQAGAGSAQQDGGFFRITASPLDVAYAWEFAGRSGAGAVTAAVLGALLAGVLRGLRRGVRLGARDPRRRLAGAWWELRDGLRLAGAAPRPADTVTDVLVRSDALLPPPGGGRREWTLGQALNAMAFVPPQERAEGVGAAAAAAASSEVRAYTAALRRRSGRGRRLLWWVDPRPLFWRRR
ncbi:DUF3488 and transglutaminase-like domain-containing protein [Streptomonospora wellingtoniae]|uniref:TransglutaminaseTgpA domain-containing protein n=1 Tax=Streptomonospora wellingtoniae TaxID=3075544 RepID=A0ABU2KNL7_9ACTN|nr:transglutaminaseTgpA domain-containing protein [Streptomonospora sp. DSM 45055]MDT0300743.1 transglutaminaseTgpA domain-containing protein [Streptomonospora sp. DSM 45055]